MALYEKSGVRFMYPDNWVIEETDDDEAQMQVSANSPDTAFWSLSLYPGQLDVRRLLEEVLQALQSEYEELEFEPTDEWIDRTPLVGYDIGFSYLDLTNSAFARVFHWNDATCLVLCQAEDRELETAEQVFRAMTHSLVTGEGG